MLNCNRLAPYIRPKMWAMVPPRSEEASSAEELTIQAHLYNRLQTKIRTGNPSGVCSVSNRRPKQIRVFLASPGDLNQERALFLQALKELNQGFGEGAHVEFVPLGFEHADPSLTDRVQNSIMREVDDCDVFVLTLFRRWGQLAPDVQPYSSYTEAEFHAALDRCRCKKSPRIFLFCKVVDPGSVADPGPHLKTVMGFQRLVRPHLMQQWFTTPVDFKNQLMRILKDHAKGKLRPVTPPLERIPPTKCWVPGHSSRVNTAGDDMVRIAVDMILGRDIERIEESMRLLVEHQETWFVEWFLYAVKSLGLKLTLSYANAEMLRSIATLCEARGEQDRKNILQHMADEMERSLDLSGGAA